MNKHELRKFFQIHFLNRKSMKNRFTQPLNKKKKNEKLISSPNFISSYYTYKYIKMLVINRMHTKDFFCIYIKKNIQRDYKIYL